MARCSQALARHLLGTRRRIAKSGLGAGDERNQFTSARRVLRVLARPVRARPELRGDSSRGSCSGLTCALTRCPVLWAGILGVAQTARQSGSSGGHQDGVTLRSVAPWCLLRGWRTATVLRRTRSPRVVLSRFGRDRSRAASTRGVERAGRAAIDNALHDGPLVRRGHIARANRCACADRWLSLCKALRPRRPTFPPELPARRSDRSA